MICDHCHGTRLDPAVRDGDAPIPCRHCGGFGTVHCCEGPVGGAYEVANDPLPDGVHCRQVVPSVLLGRAR